MPLSWNCWRGLGFGSESVRASRARWSTSWSTSFPRLGSPCSFSASKTSLRFIPATSSVALASRSSAVSMCSDTIPHRRGDRHGSQNCNDGASAGSTLIFLACSASRLLCRLRSRAAASSASASTAAFSAAAFSAAAAAFSAAAAAALDRSASTRLDTCSRCSCLAATRLTYRPRALAWITDAAADRVASSGSTATASSSLSECSGPKELVGCSPAPACPLQSWLSCANLTAALDLDDARLQMWRLALWLSETLTAILVSTRSLTITDAAPLRVNLAVVCVFRAPDTTAPMK